MWRRLWRWLFGAPRGERRAEGTSETDSAATVAVDPLDGELDLHAFRPGETADLVREYVLACQAKGVLALRIVHGKGKGVQRRIVHAVLDDMPGVVLRYRLAEPQRGGWGATLVELHPR
jgi:DNA-nicking Smr family endonuclease